MIELAEMWEVYVVFDYPHSHNNDLYEKTMFF